MKKIQNSLMLATILIALNCSNSFGQSAKHKEQNTNENKETTLSEDPKNIIMHHLSSFQESDLDALMSDYTNESVLITPDATYTGPLEIKPFFVSIMKHFPKQKSSFQLDKVEANDRLVYIVWHAKTPSLDVPLATDTFIIKDGKIYQQTFAGQLKFKNQ
ncbi:MAG: nuclear transport factor 2 family protein [Sphingobacteriales bacterium]